MNKVDYLKHAFEHKAYAEKAVVQSWIGIQFEDEHSSGKFKKVPFAVWVEGKQFKTIIDGQEVIVEGDVSLPLVTMDDKLTLPEGFHPFTPPDVLTTFGLLLFNVVLFYEVFGFTFSYVNQTFTKGMLEDMIRGTMVDTPPEGQQVPEGKASCAQWLRFSEHCNYLEGLGDHYIKPGGIDTMTIDPSILKRKKELFEEFKDQLTDPIVFNRIVDELVKMDYEIQMKGPSKNFYINKKFIFSARKRMFIAFGIVPSPDGKGWVPLTNSLDDGIDYSKFPAYINEGIEGSYGRSMATAFGGAKVKDMIKLIGRAIIAEVDCGSKRGETILLTADNLKSWLGGYHLVDDKPTLITKDSVKPFLGKEVTMRVPQFCKTKDGNYCKVCCGEGLGQYQSRISAEVVKVPTSNMLTAMSAMHKSGTNNTRLQLSKILK